MRTLLMLLLVVTAHALDREALTEHLKREEGFSSTPYKCTMGYWTIGYGHRCNAQTEDIDRDGAEEILEQDINTAIERARSLIGDDEPDEVEFIITAMIFQMGYNGVADFKNMLRNIKRGDYKAAAKNMLRSDWHKQTPARCRRLSAMMASVTNS